METEELKKEIIRLKQLQDKLKEDIIKFKYLSKHGKRRFTPKEQEDLLNNFQYRLKQNQWILKKITS